MRAFIALLFCAFALFLSGNAYSQEKTENFKWRVDRPVSQYREKPSEHNCGACHVSLAEQSARSAHASAYKNPYYKKSIEKLSRTQKARCNSCHSPEPIFLFGERPVLKPRDIRMEKGIMCVTCHQTKDSTMLGPFVAVESPHKSRESEYFSDGKICVPCHNQVKEFDLVTSWREGPFAETACTQCHMPSYTGRAVEHFSFVKLPEREIGSHSFPASSDITMLGNAFDFKVSVKGGKLQIEISNTGAGHLAPGGRYRQLKVTANAIQEEKATAQILAQQISYDSNNRIPPGDSLIFSADSAGHEKLVVTVEYINLLSVNDTTGRNIYKEVIYAK